MNKKKISSNLKEKESKKSLPLSISPELEQAEMTARHFGFIPLPYVEIEKSDLISAKKFSESHLATVRPWTEETERFSGYLEEKIALMRNYIDQKWNNIAIPLLGYYEGPLKNNPHLKKSKDTQTFNLEVIGSSKPISEAMIIETAFVILKERYPDKNLCVEINSVGDKESIARFTKELQNYIKKEINKIPASYRTPLKKDPYILFTIKDAKVKDFVDNAPKPMSFLSDASRTHFKDVLEYLESLNIPYEINHKLVGSKSYCSEVLFEIKEDKEIFAIGERYNSLTKKIWGKKDVPAIGIAILLHPHFVQAKKPTKNQKEEIPKFYFIQFGNEAKKKSLSIIETLRKAKIAVHQSLSKDKLSVQLAHAEKMNIPYIIMMGQKEALEETVVVRHMITRAQDTIEISKLTVHLKKLK